LHNQNWVAWIATSAASAPSQLGTARGWVNTRGLPVADLQSQLSGQLLTNPILFNEDGDWSSAVAFTGTGADGAVSTSSGNCDDWQSTSGMELSAGGSAVDTRGWSNGNGLACGNGYALYCFAIDSSAALPNPLPATQGRLAFVSEPVFTPSSEARRVRRTRDGQGRDEGSGQCGSFCRANGVGRRHAKPKKQQKPAPVGHGALGNVLAERR
jgi:hypothetical protein